MVELITSEIHAGSALLFNTKLPEEVRPIFREKLANSELLQLKANKDNSSQHPMAY